MRNIKTVLNAILWGCIVIVFTVVSGIVCSVASNINTQNKIWIVQGIFSWLSIIPVIFYIQHNHGLRFSIIKNMSKEGIKDCFYFIPFITILVTMLINGFAKENAIYFICSAFFTLGVGVSEELYFRGIVISILDKKFSRGQVILISTLIFGLGHSAAAFSGMTGILVLLTIVNALLFGWLVAEVLYCIHGLLPIMLFHFLFDYLSKAAPLAGETQIYVEFIRGTIMLIFSVYYCIKRLNKKKKLDLAMSNK